MKAGITPTMPKLEPNRVADALGLGTTKEAISTQQKEVSQHPSANGGDVKALDSTTIAMELEERVHKLVVNS